MPPDPVLESSTRHLITTTRVLLFGYSGALVSIVEMMGGLLVPKDHAYFFPRAERGLTGLAHLERIHRNGLSLKYTFDVKRERLMGSEGWMTHRRSLNGETLSKGKCELWHRPVLWLQRAVALTCISRRSGQE